jgi:hypothetical protein
MTGIIVCPRCGNGISDDEGFDCGVMLCDVCESLLAVEVVVRVMGDNDVICLAEDLS